MGVVKNRFSLKRLQTKMMVFVLPVLLLMTCSLSWISYTFAEAMIVNEIESGMGSRLAETMQAIHSKLAAHIRIPQTLARVVEANGTDLREEAYRSILLNLPDLNADTLGVGVWYEPNRYSTDRAYFGPYAYKDGDQVVYTEEYMTKEYDYPHWEWYRNGVNTTEAVAFTDPYYDETTDITMITATVPFHDRQNKLMGVTTGDINLRSIQALIRDIRVGNGGWAFLIDKKGRLIAGRESDNMMKSAVTADPNASLAALGQEMLGRMTPQGDSPMYRGTFTEEKEPIAVYYTQIPETGWILALAAPERELYAPLRDLLNRLLLVIAVALSVMAVVVVGFSRYMTRNIGKVNKLSSRLSAGDLTMRLDIRTGDELEQMGDNFNRMVESLKEMMRTIARSSGEAAVHAEQMRIGSSETVKATSDISASIVEVAEGTEKESEIVRRLKGMSDEITEGMEQITRSVKEVASSTEVTHNAATQGNEGAYELIRHMQRIHSAVDASADNVARLEEKSKRIETVASLIASIASQTGLLALNAAIEAARAGEAGRGFGIVASEVRKLADQVTAATTQIETTIAEINGTVAETAESMRNSVAEVNAGLATAGHTGQSFAHITEAVEVVKRQTNGVSAAVERIYSTMADMAASMDEMNGLTEATAAQSANVAAAVEQQYAAMEQMSASAESISHQAQELKMLLKRFSF